MADLDRDDFRATGAGVGMMAGSEAFLTDEAFHRTSGYFQEMHNRLSELPGLQLGGDRNTGVSQAWQWEKLEVDMGGPGNRQWTPSERQELSATGHVHRIEMHHINNVHAHPDLASHPDNLVPVSREEHFLRHDQNWQKDTEGPLLHRHDRVEDANLHRVFTGEALTAIGVGGGAFLLGSFSSWILDRHAGWRTHVKRGAVSGGLAVLGYGTVRAVGLVAEHAFHASTSTISSLMMGSGLGFGMLVSGILAYRRGARGWDLAGHVAWTGMTGVASMAAAICAKGFILSLVAKGALTGAVGGPLGVLVGVGVALAVGLVLEGVRRWWKKNDMTRKVGEWAGAGIQILTEAGRVSLAHAKAVASGLWNGTKWLAGKAVEGLTAAASVVWEGTQAVATGAKDLAKAALEVSKAVVAKGTELVVKAVATTWETAKKVADTVADTVADGLKLASKALGKATKAIFSPLTWLWGS